MPVFSRKAQDAAVKLWIHSASISTSFSRPSIPRDVRGRRKRAGGRGGPG